MVSRTDVWARRPIKAMHKMAVSMIFFMDFSMIILIFMSIFLV